MLKIPFLSGLCLGCAAATVLSTPGHAQSPTPQRGARVGVQILGAKLLRPLPMRLQDERTPEIDFAVGLFGGVSARARSTRDLGFAHGSLGLTFENLEKRRFYGTGNATRAPRPSDHYRFRPERLEAAARLEWPIGESGRFRVGPDLGASYTEALLDDEDRSEIAIARMQGHLADDDDIIRTLNPYGAGFFVSTGLSADLVLETGSPFEGEASGVRFEASAQASPALFDVESAYGRLSAELSAFHRFDLPGAPTLAVRVGGAAVGGDAPFLDLAYVGGSSTLRGYRRQRFAGDRAAWAGAEIRIRTGTDRIASREVEWGPLFYADAGRVSMNGHSPGGWHTGYGGGLWVRPLNGGPVFSATAGHGEEFRLSFGVGLFSWK